MKKAQLQGRTDLSGGAAPASRPLGSNGTGKSLEWRIDQICVTNPIGRMSGSMANEQVATLKKSVVITNKLGLHARPAALFVKTANRFNSEVLVEKDGETINGKSIMGLMMLAAGPGSRLTLHVRGADAPQALAELEALVRNKFHEE